MLTLTGAGGIGKTSLALEAGRVLLERYADGAWLVELAAVTDARLVAPQIASVLGIRDVQGQPLLTTLVAALQPREVLLVLDNCEQVLEAAPEVSELLRGCPSLAVLATSRSPLRISGEHELLLTPLTTPAAGGEDAFQTLAQAPAVRLFVERARAARANFALTVENAAAVGAICVRLDGLPLALELAAARVKLFAPEALLARLDRSLGLLTGGPNDRPERQRTLRGAIAWSYELLTEPEQRLFRRLGAFAGGFTMSAVEAVCTNPGETADELLDTLAALVDRSLVQANEGLDDGEGEPRFTMFETLREFASEQLAVAGDEGLCRRRHLEHFLALMEAAEQGLTETAPIATVLRTRRLLAAEQANLRAALQWAVFQWAPLPYQPAALWKRARQYPLGPAWAPV
jgi:predicted ATPase